MIVIQDVVVSWTKEGRAGETAVRRNAVPEAFALPYLPEVDGGREVLLHTVRVDEATGFAPKHEVRAEELTRVRIIGCARLYADPFPAPERLRVRYVYDGNCGGAPPRTSFPRDVFTLAPGEQARVVYNGRFSSTGTSWYYRKRVLSVAWVDERPHPDLFVRAEPETFRDLADLW